MGISNYHSRKTILNELHRDHPGCSRMKSVAHSYLWWPGLDQDIENITNSCMFCQSVRNTPQTVPLHPWTWPTKSWQRIHIDYAGPFLNTNFLVVVDAHSKWLEVFEMKSTKLFNILQSLKHEYGEELHWLIPFPGDWHALKNYQVALLKPYYAPSPPKPLQSSDIYLQHMVFQSK